MTRLTHKANVVYCLKGSCDKIQIYMRVQEHLSGKSRKSAIHEHISSCKDCHSCSINSFYILSQANTDFDANINEALYI